jgi:hypothetical protein
VVDSATAALYLALSSVAPVGQTDSTAAPGSMVMAARAPAEISLDGILSEAGWTAAIPLSSFTQREPNVFLDCYHDRRTGFYFGVNAAGTFYDGTLYNDDWDSDTWDGVWDGQVSL